MTRTRVLRLAFSLTLTLALATTLAAAEERFRFDSDRLTLVNLIGEISVSGHDGSGIDVVVQRRGADGADIDIEQDDGSRAELVLDFPGKSFTYPRMRRGQKKRFSFDGDGAGGLWGALFGRGQIKVSGNPTLM